MSSSCNPFFIYHRRQRIESCIVGPKARVMHQTHIRNWIRHGWKVVQKNYNITDFSEHYGHEIRKVDIDSCHWFRRIVIMWEDLISESGSTEKVNASASGRQKLRIWNVIMSPLQPGAGELGAGVLPKWRTEPVPCSHMGVHCKKRKNININKGTWPQAFSQLFVNGQSTVGVSKARKIWIVHIIIYSGSRISGTLFCWL